MAYWLVRSRITGFIYYPGCRYMKFVLGSFQRVQGHVAYSAH